MSYEGRRHEWVPCGTPSMIWNTFEDTTTSWITAICRIYYIHVGNGTLNFGKVGKIHKSNFRGEEFFFAFHKKHGSTFNSKITGF